MFLITLLSPLTASGLTFLLCLVPGHLTTPAGSLNLPAGSLHFTKRPSIEIKPFSVLFPPVIVADEDIENLKEIIHDRRIRLAIGAGGRSESWWVHLTSQE